MQSHSFVFLLLSIAFTEGLLFSSKPKCPIKEYKSSKSITGAKLLVHENFHERVKSLDTLAKDCKVHVYIKGSYFQLKDPAQQVQYSEVDLAIGHGFQFELRDEKNAVLCNTLCLSKDPMTIPEARCFLQGARNRGLSWSQINPSVMSDGTYHANPSGYQNLKTDIQTRCQNQNLKREILRTLRKMYEDDETDNIDDNNNEEDEKKK